MKTIFKYRKLIFVLFFILATFILLFSQKSTDASTEKLQSGIAEKIVRFHVLANSDSDADQTLKLMVKDEVVKYLSPLLSNSSSLAESKHILMKENDTISSIAKQVISANGFNYDVNTELTTTYFPTKRYGSFSFPPGYYQAYQIKIGNAEGHNWWCVLYPPLCLIDISHSVVDDKAANQLETVLTQDEYDAVSGKARVKFKFKYLTFLNSFID